MHCLFQIYSCNPFLFNNKKTDSRLLFDILHIKNTYFLLKKKSTLYIILCIQALLNGKVHIFIPLKLNPNKISDFRFFFHRSSLLLLLFYPVQIQYHSLLSFLVTVFHYVYFSVYIRPQAVIKKSQIKNNQMAFA